MVKDAKLVSQNMKKIRSKDTSIEVRLRKALWHKGYRYRKNYNKLPRKPDIVLTKYKIAVFCDSEFFQENDKKLLFFGWNVIHFWNKEILSNTDECVRVIEEAIWDIYILENE